MKYKQNIWLRPGMANFFASPSLSLAADAGAWKSYSYMEQHSPKDKPALVELLAPKEEFYFPATTYFDRTEGLFDFTYLLFLQKRWRSSYSPSPGRAAVPRRRASLCSPQPRFVGCWGLTLSFLIRSQS